MEPTRQPARRRLARAFNAAAFVVGAALLGVPVGCAAWLFLLLMDALLSLVWDLLPQALGVSGGLLPFWFVLAVTATGALVLAANERVNPARVVPIMPVLATVRKTGRYEYRGHRSAGYFASAILPLAFGSSVGPEAGLTNVVASLCTWAGDAMRTLGARCRARSDEGRLVVPADLWRAASKADPASGALAKPLKIAAYLAALAGGVAAFALLAAFVGGGMSLPRVAAGAAVVSRPPVERLAWVVPCLAVGVAGGALFSLCDKAAGRLGERLAGHAVLRNLLVAVLLALLGSCVPYVMFSGEEDLSLVVAGWRDLGVPLLVAMALARCALTPLCIRCGWAGGQFFPLIFVGVVLGYACALAGGAGPVPCVALVSAALLGVVMRKPVVAAALMLLVMPVRSLPLLLVAGLVGSVVPLPASWGVAPRKRFGRRAKAAS